MRITVGDLAMTGSPGKWDYVRQKGRKDSRKDGKLVTRMEKSEDERRGERGGEGGAQCVMEAPKQSKPEKQHNHGWAELKQA